MTPLLSVSGLNKSFAAPVLRDFAFELAAGEIHALVGGNGAGKSTFANILSGLLPADSGTVLLHGQSHAPRSRREARDQGVTLMLQELHLIPTLSVAENLFLHELPSRFGWVGKGRLREAASHALAEVGLEGLDPDTPTATLGVGHQQLVVLAGALQQDSRLIILDEPTAALTSREISTLFGHLHRLRSEGRGIIYISHRMEELREIADAVSVLRDGERIAHMPMAEITTAALVSLMAGRELECASRPPSGQGVSSGSGHAQPVALRVSGLTHGHAVKDVSFEVRRGEILGLSGLVGAGRTETLRAIFGADRPDAGTIEAGDPLVPLRIRQPRDAVRAGIGLVPEDRKQDGLLLPFGMRLNTSLASLHGAYMGRQEREDSERLRVQLDVRCQDIDQSTARLSGGNQQKIVLARWLLRDVEVLLLDEPTRGVDAAAKETIYQQLRELAAAGKALVVVSSELPELMALCDRIAVMSAGRLVETFHAGDWSAERLTEAAFRHHLTTPQAPVAS